MLKNLFPHIGNFMMHSDMVIKAPIFLIGYRCTGKTTIGKLLAHRLARPFVDTDAQIESQFNMSIAHMVETRGWAFFRQCETRVLVGLELSHPPVVATGGGIILSETNRKWIKNAGVPVWLTADESVLVERIRKDAPATDHRPDLTRNSIEKETHNMLKIRIPLYQDLAKITINTGQYPPKTIADMILKRLEHEKI